MSLHDRFLRWLDRGEPSARITESAAVDHLYPKGDWPPSILGISTRDRPAREWRGHDVDEGRSGEAVSDGG